MRKLLIALSLVASASQAQECAENGTTQQVTTNVSASTMEYDGHQFILFIYAKSEFQVMHHPSCQCLSSKEQKEESYFSIW